MDALGVGPLRERLARALGEDFRVEEPLGEGGFAHVVAATDLRLKRRVAVKVLRPELASGRGLLERFRAEAEAMAAIRHPHVVPVHDVGEAEGLAWFVMPLVEGPTLSERLERTPRLEPREARRILREAAAGLGAAHERGRVHRDVKPSNLLLEGAEERVVVADFGIARALEGEEDRPGSIFTGSPEYASPEQLAGDPVDARSDLYSLGVVAYRMLSGRLPFEAEAAQALVVRQVMEDPEPLDAHRPDLPRELVEVVHRCLRKEPSERFADATALVASLERGATGGGDAEAGGRTAVAGGAREPRGRSGEGGRIGSRFPAQAGAVAGAVAAAVILDGLVLDQLLLSPPALLVGVGVLAHRWGTLWTRGLSPREILTGRPAADESRAADGRPTAPVRQEGLLRASRSIRARIVRQLERLSKAERERFERVLPVVDGTVHRVRRDAARLLALDERIRKARSAPEGWAAALANELAEARAGVQDDLECSLALLEEIRSAAGGAVDGGEKEREVLVALLRERRPGTGVG